MNSGGPIRTREDFERTRQAWMRAAEEGRLEEALAMVESSTPWVEQLGDPTLRDRVICNRARLAIELGRDAEDLPALRTILMLQRDAENCFLAAYSIARAYELRKELRKARFYAQVARDRARQLDAERLGSSLNQIANVAVAESHFDEAAALYREALALEAETSPARSAVILYNLGYCEIVLGARSEGFRHLYRAARLLRRLGSRRHLMLASLDLAFAHLEAGKPRAARRHARRALDLAREFAIQDAEKNALYLAGAAAKALGDEFAARRWFRDLQTGFYPDADYLPDLLLTVDVRSLVNLKA
jgi:tetratricopeptide (TPR) repeat protein